MTHLVIATHAHLADALRDAAGMLLGDVQGVSAVNFVPGQTVAELIAQYTQIVEDTPDTEVLFLVDLFGGSPYNAAVQFIAGRTGFDVVSGVNLPMLLETLIKRMRGVGLVDLVDVAEQGGSSGIRTYHEALARISSAEADADHDESF